jgi:hypothetical protein
MSNPDAADSFPAIFRLVQLCLGLSQNEIIRFSLRQEWLWASVV